MSADEWLGEDDLYAGVEPDCYGDCVRLGQRVSTCVGTGPVCWEGPGRDGRHRVGVRIGGDMEFFDCQSVHAVEVTRG